MNKSIRNKLMFAGLVLLFVLSLVTVSGLASDRSISQGNSLGEAPELIIRAEYVEGGAGVRIPPPENFLRAAPETATINVTYFGTWPPGSKAAFEYATDIWETQITSTLTIEVSATMTDTLPPEALGSARAAGVYRNFSSAPEVDTWYPVALANKLSGTDLNGSDPEIEAKFNSARSDWYYETDLGVGFSQYDFVSVVLHEIGHGLGFFGSMSVSGGGMGSWGIVTIPPDPVDPMIYDRFAVNGDGGRLLNTILFPNLSITLTAQLVGDNLFFDGSYAVLANGGVLPKLYAPSPWDQGSSFSHLDEVTYPMTNTNTLMTPSIFNGEARHSPGPITLGIFKDIGWTIEVQVPKIIYLPQIIK